MLRGAKMVFNFFGGNGNDDEVEDRDLTEETNAGFDAGVTGALEPPKNSDWDQEQKEAAEMGFEDGVITRSRNGGSMPSR